MIITFITWKFILQQITMNKIDKSKVLIRREKPGYI